MTPDLRPYMALMTAFSDRRLRADEFQAAFVALFKSDQLLRPPEIYELLNEVFLGAEALAQNADAEAGPYAVDEEELHAVVEANVARLRHAVDAIG